MPPDIVRELVLMVPAELKFVVPLTVNEPVLIVLLEAKFIMPPTINEPELVRLATEIFAVTPGDILIVLKFEEGRFIDEILRLPAMA